MALSNSSPSLPPMALPVITDSGIVASTRTFVPFVEAPPEVEDILKRQRSPSLQNRCGKLLERFGWGSGVRVPFASKENQDLEKNLEFKQRKILALQTELTDNNEHADSLEKHLDKMNEDIYSVQKLLNTKKGIIEEEKNLVGSAERMLKRATKERTILQKSTLESKARCILVQKDMDRRLKRVLELRDLIEFDSEALKGYHERLKMFTEKSSDVTRLSMEDSKTIKELEEAKVDLGGKKKELRHQLDQEAMNTAKYQEQFDRLSIEFRKVHKQRLDMVSMWSSTIQAMSDKDTHMKQIADEYFNTKKELHKKKDTIADKERQLRQETCGIRGTDLALSDLDRRLGEIRRRITEENDIHLYVKDSCALCQLEAQSASNLTKAALEGLFKLEADIRAMYNRGSKMRKLVQQLKEKMREIEYGRNNADTRMAELEKILNEEESAAEKFVKEMDVLRKYHWERSNDRSVTIGEIQTLETFVQRIQNNLAMMQTKENSNSELVSRRTGTIYRLDLECSMLENRINRMTNQTIDPRYFDLQNTVKELREIDMKLTRDKKYMQSELEHVQKLTHNCNTEISQSRRDKVILEDDLQQCNMNCHSLEKLTNQSSQELNDELVRQSLERVYLKRLVDELKSERQQMFGLSEIRNTIHWAVKERKAEIENHRILNSSRLKALAIAVSKLRVQTGELNYRNNRLRGRFELISKLMSTAEEVDPEKETMAYQVRKMARARETFQMESNRWKMRLEEGEKELEGLMNVYKIMAASNESLKESLAPADENSEERQELESLNENEEEIVIRRNKAKRFRGILVDRIEELTQQIANMDQEIHATIQHLNVKEAVFSKLEQELKRHKEKVSRWSSMGGRVLREIKESLPTENFEIIELDLKLRFTLSKLESAIAMLQRTVIQHQKMVPKVNNFLNQFGILDFHRLQRLSSTPPRDDKSRSTSSSYSPIPDEITQRESQYGQRDSTASRTSDVLSVAGSEMSTRVVKRMKPRSRVQSNASRISTMRSPPTVSGSFMEQPKEPRKPHRKLSITKRDLGSGPKQ